MNISVTELLPVVMVVAVVTGAYILLRTDGELACANLPKPPKPTKRAKRRSLCEASGYRDVRVRERARDYAEKGKEAVNISTLNAEAVAGLLALAFLS